MQSELALRGFDRPEEPRLLSDNVEVEWIRNLESHVVGSYPRLSHHYYWLKAKWMGRERLEFFDRNADLPFGRYAETAWSESCEAVLGTFADVSPALGTIADEMIRNRRIDAVWRSGKSSGSFCHQTVEGAPKYVAVSHYGNTTDQIRLTWLMGNGVHQHLAAAQGELLAPVSLPFANTISSFFETLAFSRMLARITDPGLRRFELAGFVGSRIDAIVRQISYFRFETKVARHVEAKNDLTRGDFAKYWLEEARDCVGPAFDLGAEYGDFWCHILLFIEVPFTTYVYPFGTLASNAMFARYVGQKQEFGAALVDVMKAGGSRSTAELLGGFGIDVAAPEVWQTGLGVLENMIEELESMDA